MTRGLEVSAANLVALLLVAIAAGCGTSLSTSLENRECSSDRRCLPGWVCSEDFICVRAGLATSPQLDSDDAGLPRIVSGAAQCEAGTACSGACVDLTVDVNNCGACGHACLSDAGGQAGCNAGTCELTCSPGYSRCADACYRLDDDPRHCGGCALSCPTNAEGGAYSCRDMQCQLDCNTGLLSCGGTCVQAQTDPLNCGACGAACQPGDVCAAGACVKTCPVGTAECGASCADLTIDPTNCGSCGNRCPAPPNAMGTCRDSQCGADCNAGLTRCGDVCLDAQTDISNCGSCGNVCPAGASRSHPVCAMGACTNACDSGYVACDSECISPAIQQMLSPNLPCANLARAQDLVMCQGSGVNSTYCSGACVDVRTDKQNCGRCGSICAGTCYLGNCLRS